MRRKSKGSGPTRSYQVLPGSTLRLAIELPGDLLSLPPEDGGLVLSAAMNLDRQRGL